MDAITHSPIPWPKSEKKRKPIALTPDVVDKEVGNKLSSKKKGSGVKCQLSTPRRSVSKWPMPSRRSIETFHRVYNELTNSSASSLSGRDSRNSSRLLESPVVPQLEKLRSTKSLSPILLDSESSSDEVSMVPKSNIRGRRIFIESSDDDDSFSLPPPLSERMILTPNPESIPKKTRATKLPKSVNKRVRKKGKENFNDNEGSSKKPIICDDSSSEKERRTVKDKEGTTSMKSKSLGSSTENFLNHERSCRKVTFDDSSSEEELPDILPVENEQTPGLLNVPQKCKEPASVPCAKPVLSILKTTATTNFKPTQLGSSTESTRNHEASCRKLIFDDSSSEDELPDIPSTSSLVSSKTPEPLSARLKHKMPASVPRTPCPKPALPILQFAATSHESSPKVWTNPECCSFLRSLSDASPIERETAHFRKQFKQHKDDLVKELYTLFNRTVFENKLPPEMSITWNVRLTATAGFCYQRLHRDKSRTARIELSTKILDSAERVRDTLLHELCHAAAFVVYGYRDGHGPFFKHWGRKAGSIYPFLPVVSRCHNYVINTKYVYRCVDCKKTYGRHSKSINMETKVCGHCKGWFELLVNGVVKVPAKTKAPEHARNDYKSLKSDQKTKRANIMNDLGKMLADKAKL